MSRVRPIATWILQVLLGALFILVGVGKFQQWDGWTGRFEAWGYAAWFLALIAGLEIVGGVMVLFPRLASFGAALIAVIMVGAAYTHASTGIGSPANVVVHLLFCAAVGTLRWPDRWRAA